MVDKDKPERLGEAKKNNKYNRRVVGSYDPPAIATSQPSKWVDNSIKVIRKQRKMGNQLHCCT